MIVIVVIVASVVVVVLLQCHVITVLTAMLGISLVVIVLSVAKALQ